MARFGPPRKLKPEQVRAALDRLLRGVAISIQARELGVAVCILRRDLRELHGGPLPTVYPPRERRAPEISDRMREIVRLRRRGLLQREIAERFGLTYGRVSQILKDAQRLGLWDGKSIAAEIRARHVRREAYAKRLGRTVWQQSIYRKRKKAA